jgi:4-amino-4-deoxychorismate lyase
MFPCFETIKVENSKLKNLEFHQKRVDFTRQKFFGYEDKLDLAKLSFDIQNGALKVEYEKDFLKTTCRELKPRNFRRFKVLNSEIRYDFKYVDRKNLDALHVDGYDDIIITKNGLLKDTSIANIALFIKDTWFTPRTPLLNGTTRDRLIRNGFLKTKDLYIDDLKKAKHFAIMNALLDFKIIENLSIDFL